MTKTTIRDLNSAEHELTSARKRYLEERGWEYICNTPGSFWVWRRDFADVDAWRKGEHEAGRISGAEPKPYGVVTVVEAAHAVQMTQVGLEEFYLSTGNAEVKEGEKHNGQ